MDSLAPGQDGLIDSVAKPNAGRREPQAPACQVFGHPRTDTQPRSRSPSPAEAGWMELWTAPYHRLKSVANEKLPGGKPAVNLPNPSWTHPWPCIVS